MPEGCFESGEIDRFCYGDVLQKEITTIIFIQAAERTK
jgi:hypothetical protein